jgi:hypothetical protein
MMRDLARTIELDSSTALRQVHKFLPEHSAKELRMQFGRDRRTLLIQLPQWAKAVRLHHSQQYLLGEIIRRSRQEAPWTWEDRYGVARMAEYFGMAKRTFQLAVKNLTEQGDLKVHKIRRGHTIYRVPQTTINAINGRGNVGLKPMTNVQPLHIRPKESSSLCEPKPAPVLVSDDRRQGRYIPYSNSSREEVEKKKVASSKEERRSSGAVYPMEHRMDEGPVLGRDPEAPQADPAKGTKVTQFAQYFEQRWARVDCADAHGLNWPQQPWSVGKKTAFLGWAKQTLLPGYRDDLDLLRAMVDEFCEQHERYFSAYRSGAVWKQFNRNLDRIKANVVLERPELEPAGQPEPVESTMDWYRRRSAEAEAKAASGVPRKSSQFRG